MFDAPANELFSTPTASRAARTGGLPRGYVAAWSGMTCLAVLYITQVALQTVNLPQLIASAPGSAPQTGRAQEAELETLRHSLAEFQRDVGRVRTDSESRKLDAGLVASLSALEERMSMTTGVAVTKATPPANTVPAPAIASAPSPQAPVVTSAAALDAWTGRQPPVAPEVRPIALAPPALEKLTAPIETGSIVVASPIQPNKMSGQLPKAALPQVQAAVPAPPAAAVTPQAVPASPISFGPALVKAEPKPFAVQLASGASVDEIRYSWSILSEQNAEVGKLQPRYTSTTSDTAGATFDLIAGPVKTAADAKRICKSLAARGIDCKVASYSGEAF